MVRRVLVWVGSQLAANTLLLWNALHLANAPCPSSDRHTIHGHEAYLGEEKIEWSSMLQVIDFYATRESQHVICFQMASNKTVFAEKRANLTNATSIKTKVGQAVVSLKRKMTQKKLCESPSTPTPLPFLLYL